MASPLDPYADAGGPFHDPTSAAAGKYLLPVDFRTFAATIIDADEAVSSGFVIPPEYLTESEATALFYTKSQSDARFALIGASYTKTESDARYEQLANKGQPNGYASLDGSGLIPTAQLPPLAVTDTFVAANQAEMLALTAQRGDLCIRTDTGRTYVLAAEPASTLANWKEVLAAGQVTSVNGQTGVVNLTAANVGAATPADVTSAISVHEAASNPHPVYLTQPEGDLLYAAIGHNHDATYVNVTGDSMSGALTISGKTVGASASPGNSLVWNADGFFVALGSVPISADPDNVLQMKADGLFVRKGLIFGK